MRTIESHMSTFLKKKKYKFKRVCKIKQKVKNTQAKKTWKGLDSHQHEALGN